METTSYYICIDIGGTFIKHAILRQNGEIFCIGKCPTEAAKGGISVRSKVLHIIKDYLRLLQAKYRILGICISTAGVVDIESGGIVYSSGLIPGYTGINYKQYIEERFGIPCEVENDVNCMGLAESTFGAGKDTNLNLCLTVGTGIGGAFIIDRQVFRGYSGSACNVGFMKIPGGEFQELASTRALCCKVNSQKGILEGEWDGVKIFQEAKKHDRICIKEVEDLIDTLALGMANLCYILNPQNVILGGGIMEQENYIKPRLTAKLKDYLPEHIFKNTSVNMASCGNNAGCIGALLHFKTRQKID